MPKRNKHYSAFHLKPHTHPYARCRWCQYDFSCIRGHYARSQHCQKLELEYINKRSKPDPIPFNNFFPVFSSGDLQIGEVNRIVYMPHHIKINKAQMNICFIIEFV